MTVWRCFVLLHFSQKGSFQVTNPPWMDNMRYYSFIHVHISFRDARFYESALDDLLPQWNKIAYKYFERKMNLNSSVTMKAIRYRQGLFSLIHFNSWCPEMRRKVHCRQWIYLEKMESNLGFFFALLSAHFSQEVLSLDSHWCIIR